MEMMNSAIILLNFFKPVNGFVKKGKSQ